MIIKKTNGPYNIFTEEETVVEFFHADPLGVVWHGNYLNFFEIGRRALLEKIGYDYNDMKNSGYAFPVIETYTKFIKPVTFKDRIKIKAVLLEYENRLKMQFEIQNIQTGLITTMGISTQMAIKIDTMESCFICPDILINKIEALIKENK